MVTTVTSVTEDPSAPQLETSGSPLKRPAGGTSIINGTSYQMDPNQK